MQWDSVTFHKKSAISTSATQQHISERCIFYGLLIATDGTNDLTINIYDGTNDTGDIIYVPNIVVSGSLGLVYIAPEPILINKGVYVKITTSGSCSHRIFYDN